MPGIKVTTLITVGFMTHLSRYQPWLVIVLLLPSSIRRNSNQRSTDMNVKAVTSWIVTLNVVFNMERFMIETIVHMN